MTVRKTPNLTSKLTWVSKINSTTGDTVHLMSATSAPYGASSPPDSYSYFTCLFSEPDTGELNNVTSGRYVPRSSTDHSLALPSGTESLSFLEDNFILYSLPPALEAQGVFYCETSTRGLITRVPVTILAHGSKLI